MRRKPRPLLTRLLRTSVYLFLIGLLSAGPAASAAVDLDGTWVFQTSTKSGQPAKKLPDGDTIVLKVKGSRGEIVVIPGHSGAIETVIKSLCTRLYGTGKISYKQKHAQDNANGKNAIFDISQIKGDDSQILCPAAELLSRLAGKEIADQIENHSLKLPFQYKMDGNKLNLTTTYKNEPIALVFHRK